MGEQEEAPAAVVAGGSGRHRDLPKVTELEDGGPLDPTPDLSSSQNPVGSFTPTSPARCALRAQTLRVLLIALRPSVVFFR